MKRRREVEELNTQELREVLERARSRPIEEHEYQKLKGVLDMLVYLTDLIEKGKMSLRRMRQIIFGFRTEKTKTVLQAAGSAASPATEAKAAEAPGSTTTAKAKPRGHGRNGAAEYTGANRIWVPHESLKPGDPCPGCHTGKVYASMEPARLVRLVGQAPVGATVTELEKLRCGLCGEVYTAQAPEGIGEEKYDATSAAIIATLKYGSGMPFYRLEQLQGNLGIPLPASTQWEIVAETADKIRPAFNELVRQAAQGEVIHNDDTTAKILAIMKERAKNAENGKQGERTGTFTSGIVSIWEGRRMALFFTGPHHAGENLADLLRQREADLPPPIQMCDALSRNLPKEF
jgi:transposase